MTALFDAVLTALEKLSETKGRAALPLFSDGADLQPGKGGSDASMGDAIEAGRLSEASIYTIGFKGRSRAGGYSVSKGFLRLLARASGGSAYFPEGVKELERTFSRIQSELHSQYRIAPSNINWDGSWRDVEVRIKGTAQFASADTRGLLRQILGVGFTVGLTLVGLARNRQVPPKCRQEPPMEKRQLPE